MQKLRDRIKQFETGELGFDEVSELFQELVDTGLAWSLGSFYQQLAVDLINMGYVKYTAGTGELED